MIPVDFEICAVQPKLVFVFVPVFVAAVVVVKIVDGIVVATTVVRQLCAPVSLKVWDPTHL